MTPARIIIASISLVLWTGCTAPPRPLGPESAVVGIKIDLSSILKELQGVQFVRISDPEDDPSDQDALIQSNYTDGGYVYLLNAEPGLYAAVAVSYCIDIPEPLISGYDDPCDYWFVDFFSEALIRKTLVTVSPSSLAFMGELKLDRLNPFEKARGMEGASPVQSHYYQLRSDIAFLDALANPNQFLIPIWENEHDLDQSEKAWLRFVDHSREKLVKAGWSEVLPSHVGDAQPQ